MADGATPRCHTVTAYPSRGLTAAPPLSLGFHSLKRQQGHGRGLDAVLQDAHELGAFQAGRDRRQVLVDDGPGPAQEAVGGPVDAGVGGDGMHGHIQLAVEGGDAGLIVAGHARLAR